MLYIHLTSNKKRAKPTRIAKFGKYGPVLDLRNFALDRELQFLKKKLAFFAYV